MDEWRALPWWQERLYLEGLVARTRRERAMFGVDVPDEPVGYEPAVSSDRLIPLAEVGANVTHVRFG